MIKVLLQDSSNLLLKGVMGTIKLRQGIQEDSSSFQDGLVIGVNLLNNANDVFCEWGILKFRKVTDF